MSGTAQELSKMVTMKIDREIHEQLAEAAERLHLQGPGVLANVLLEDIGDASMMADRYLESIGR
jgi:hypothetical protein